MTNSVDLPHKITLSGYLGSGKTVVGKLLAKKHGLTYYSTGSIQREIASRQGITTLELNRQAETSREIDDSIDSFSRELNLRDEKLIIDSRLAWHFIEGAFKVFLKVDEQEAARRIMGDVNRQSEKYQTLEEALNAVRARRKSEQDRFLNLYGVKLYDFANYHIVVDTTSRKPEETVEFISDCWQKFLAGEDFPNRLED